MFMQIGRAIKMINMCTEHDMMMMQISKLLSKNIPTFDAAEPLK